MAKTKKTDDVQGVRNRLLRALYFFSVMDGEVDETRLMELCASPVEEAFIDECKRIFEEQVRPQAQGYEEEDWCDVIIETAGSGDRVFDPDTLLELLKYAHLSGSYEGAKKRFIHHLARVGRTEKALYTEIETLSKRLADIEAQREAAKSSNETYRRVIEILAGLEQQERELLKDYETRKQSLSSQPVTESHPRPPAASSDDFPQKRRGRPKAAKEEEATLEDEPAASEDQE
ncbi:MAG: hypothetical protein LBS86_04435 [Treponema sp.]|jgi:hypothetical protein|nr:hypothetical protein [Treponema sp.]